LGTLSDHADGPPRSYHELSAVRKPSRSALNQHRAARERKADERGNQTLRAVTTKGGITGCIGAYSNARGEMSLAVARRVWRHFILKLS
jgi:hypothetical protein